MTTVSLPGRPHGVASTPLGVFCVTQVDSSTLSCGKLDDPGVMPAFDFTVHVGSGPATVAINPNGATAYTANQDDTTLSVVNLSQRSLTATLPLSGAGYNVLVSPSGNRVYVATASGTLDVIDATTLQTIATLHVGGVAYGLAYDRAGDVLYVGSMTEGNITAVDASNNTSTRTYDIGGYPMDLVTSPDGEELYILSQDKPLQILNVADGAMSTAILPPAGSSGLTLGTKQATLYATQAPSGAMYVVDRITHNLVRTIYRLGTPVNVAYDSAAATAIVPDEKGAVHFVPMQAIR